MRIMRMCLVMAALVVCLAGCAKRYGFTAETLFEVDGVTYRLCRHYVNVDPGYFVSSSLVIVPHSDCEGRLDIRGTFMMIYTDNKRVIAKDGILYFLRHGKIEFEKKYHDLGIEETWLGGDLETVRDYLQPILEDLIRQHVLPQE